MVKLSFEEFVKIGFNRNEAKVYLALVKFGSSDAKQLIKETGFHKNIVYDNLEKLMDKGLVSFIIEEKRRVYKAEPPEMLSAYMEKEEQKAQENKQRAKELSAEIAKYKVKRPEENQATMFRGIQGVKLVLKSQLESGEDYVSFGAPKEATLILGEHYWQNYRVKQQEIKSHGKLLFNESMRDEQKLIPSINKVRFLDKASEPLTQTIVYGDKTAIIIWTEKPVCMLVESKEVAASYRAFFDILWEQAKA